MSVDKFIITKEDANYSIIPNVISQNITDAEALGLYIYFLSLPPQWEFYKNVIKKHFGWGRDKLDKKITILREHNLIDLVGNRNEKGQFVDWNLHVRNGRDFIYTQNTENTCSGELSTGVSKNSTQNTENTAAVKPVTGFSTPIKNTNTNNKDFKKKSFCADAQKKRKREWRKENSKVHDFAESKNQMACEAKNIEQHEAIKRTYMSDRRSSLI